MARVNGGVLIAVSLAVILTVSACGGGGSNSTTNATPSFTSKPITTAEQDKPYTYNVSTTDSDVNDVLTITAPTLPTWLTFTDNDDGTATLNGTPSKRDAGDHPVTIQVEDNGTPVKSATQSFTINVENAPPEFTSTPVRSAKQDRRYTYNVSATDPNASDNLTITAKTLPTWLRLTDNSDGTAVLEGTPGGGEVGIHEVILRVEDDGTPIKSATQSFEITVETAYSNFQISNFVIGQSNFESDLANQGGSPDANTLNAPNGREASGSLFVPDMNNHRILIFNTVPAANNANADHVLGQADFTSVDRGTSAMLFQFPSDVWIDDNRLFVADSLNNRILIWDDLPTGNDPADVVVGQADFNSGNPDTTQDRLWSPVSVATANNKLFIAELVNHRVLIWNTIPTTNGQAADVVLGQADFVSRDPNRGNSNPNAGTLNTPTSVWCDGERLVVSDGSNHRILIWNNIPTSDGQTADVVVGQPDFTTRIPSNTVNGLNAPRGVFSNGRQLFVADMNNNRILIFNTFPTQNQPAADIVLGQSNFTNNEPNDDDQDGREDTTPSKRTFKSVSGVFATEEQLFATDRGNNRVLIFNRR